jgi:hypothetical protein
MGWSSYVTKWLALRFHLLICARILPPRDKGSKMARHTRATPEGAVSVIHTSRISFGKLYEACSDAEELTAWFPSRKAITGQLNRGGAETPGIRQSLYFVSLV